MAPQDLVKIVLPNGSTAYVSQQQLMNITMPTVQNENVSVAQTTPRLINDLPMKEAGSSQTAKPIAKQTHQEPVVEPLERVVAISRPDKVNVSCTCNICARTFVNASFLNQHKNKKHANKKTTYVNDIRGIGFEMGPKFLIPDATPQKTVEDDKPMDANLNLADDDDTSSTTSDDSFDMSDSSDVYSTDNFPELKVSEKKEVSLNTSKLIHVPTYVSKKTLRVRAGFGKGEVDHKRTIVKNGKEVTESIYKDEVLDGNFEPVRVNIGDYVPVLSVGLTYLSCDEVAEWWMAVMPEVLHPLVQKIKVKNVDGRQMVEEEQKFKVVKVDDGRVFFLLNNEEEGPTCQKFLEWLFKPVSEYDMRRARSTEDIVVCPRYTEEYAELILTEIKLIQRRAQVCLTLKDGTSVVGWVSLKKAGKSTMKRFVDRSCKPSVRMEISYPWIAHSMDVLGKKTWVRAFEQRVIDELKVSYLASDDEKTPLKLNPTKVSFPKNFMNHFYKPSSRWCVVEFDNETDALELLDLQGKVGIDFRHEWKETTLLKGQDGEMDKEVVSRRTEDYSGSFSKFEWSDLYVKTMRSEVSVPFTAFELSRFENNLSMKKVDLARRVENIRN